MNREGVVLKVKDNRAVIMTPDGQFVNVTVKGRAIEPGEIYSGRIAGRNNVLIRYLAMAAAFIFALFSFSAIKLYYTAYASIVVDINPSIELMVNRWEKIIKAVPLNEDGGKILSAVKVNNDSLNEGLKKIVDESIRQDFIDEANVEPDKKISVSVYINKDDVKIDLSEFEDYLAKGNMRYELRQEKAGIGRDSANKRQMDIPGRDGQDNGSEDNKGNETNKDDGNSRGNGSNKDSGNNGGNQSNKGNWNSKESEIKKGNGDNKKNKSKNDSGDSRGNESNKDNADIKGNDNNKNNRNSRDNRNDKDNINSRDNFDENLKNSARQKNADNNKYYTDGINNGSANGKTGNSLSQNAIRDKYKITRQNKR